MRLFVAVFAALLPAACVNAGPTATPVGSVQFLTGTYPVESLPNGTWRARVNGAVVICARPNPTACYWSVRHHLLAQELLDDLG
mgnify:CR=1 FL=1